jgi:hypothetical protein
MQEENFGGEFKKNIPIYLFSFLELFIFLSSIFFQPKLFSKLQIFLNEKLLMLLFSLGIMCELAAISLRMTGG